MVRFPVSAIQAPSIVACHRSSVPPLKHIIVVNEMVNREITRAFRDINGLTEYMFIILITPTLIKKMLRKS